MYSCPRCGLGDIAPHGFDRPWSQKSRGIGDTARGMVDLSVLDAQDGSPFAERDDYERHASMPLHSDSFINIMKKVTLAASAVNTVICAFRMPPGYQGMIRYVGNSVLNAANIGSVTWSVVLNESPVAGFSNFIGLLSPGLYVPLPVRIDLAPNTRVLIRASNATTAAIAGVAGRLYGWAWAINSQGGA